MNVNSSHRSIERQDTDDHVSDTTHQFNLKSFTVSYDNSFSIKEIDDVLITDILVVSNFLCQRIGDKVLKKTEIRIGHQVILLEDSYCFDIPESPRPLSEKVEFETEMVPCSKNSKSDVDTSCSDEKQEKENKKNVVKNIVKAFDAWVSASDVARKFESAASFQNIRKRLQRMITRIKYNNRLVNSIVACENLRELFEEFLQQEASSWLEKSKIKDKLAHTNAIDAYLKNCSTLQSLVFRSRSSRHHADDC